MNKNLKQTTLVIIALLFYSSVLYARTIPVTSPGNNNDIQPAIQTAVNTALAGDIIQLPAGVFVLNKSVLITKFISIKGKGLNSTILYRAESVPDNFLSYSPDWNAMFRFEINQNIPSNIVISDLCLKSKKPSRTTTDGLSRAADIGIKFIHCLDFVITRCRFEYFGNGAVSVYHDDNAARGLIYKNEFYHNCKGYDALGLGYGVVVYGSNYEWVPNPKFGTSNFIFVEDNLFDYHRHSVAAGGSALYVFRYNTVINNVAGNTAHAIDAHEARLNGPGTENHFSTRAVEVYNNSIINTTYRDGTSNVADGTPIQPGGDIRWLTEACIRPRGGEMLVHHNYIRGYRFGVGIISRRTTGIGTPGVYPYPYQSGYASGLQYGIDHRGVLENRGDGDVFAWADTFHYHAPGSSANVYFYNYSPNNEDIVAERDYHLYAKGGYTPYTYPHPLRSLGEAQARVSDEEMLPFEVYPNPSNGPITVSFTSTKKATYTLTAYNFQHQSVWKQKIEVHKGTHTQQINLTQYGKGLYFISLNSDEGDGIKTVLVD